MVDIRLITILPTPQVQGVTQSPGSGGGAINVLTNAPTGSILSGFIVNRDPAGNPVLRTPTADVVFASDFFLKIGSEVVIRVENRTGQSQARILSVNGQPPSVAENVSSFAGEPDVIIGGQSSGNNQRPAATQAAPSDTIARQNTNVSVTGNVLPQNLPDGSPPSLPAGSQLTLKLVSLAAPQQPATAPPSAPTLSIDQTLPVNKSQPNSAAQPTTLSAATAPYAAYARSTAPASLTTPVATQNAVVDAPSSANSPATNSTPAKIPAIGDRITATVISNDAAGEALLQTPIGLVRLQPGTVLPLGSKVVFDIASLARPISGIPLPIVTPAELPELTTQWQSLSQISSLIGQYNLSVDEQDQLSLPALLTLNSTNTRSMATPQQMMAGLIFFVSALKGGDFRDWLGHDSADWLIRNGHESLLKRAEGEFITIARHYTDAPTQSWNMLLFPFMFQGEIHQVRLFTKRDKKEGKSQQGKQQGDTRFVIELDLTQLGEMQLDGFVRKEEEKLEFDLMVRSLMPLEPIIQQEIFRIYNRMAEITGYHGSIKFQAVKEFPVNPLDDIMANHLRDVIV
ncbi:MAG: hypothetical protein LW823_03960 [Rickettsiales bacterium]|jgi:hypothetical protein|nr:hypothetical protein [Rickettsiales bacterium]